MRNIIFATGNIGKVIEVKKIFNGSQFNIISLSDLGLDIDVPETGDTYEENALIKAKAIYDIYKEPVIADDSGLTVYQLDGRPGVYSARYAGENCTFDDNNEKVLGELKELSQPHAARYIACAVYYDGKEPIYSIGEMNGQIIKEFRGSNGFGFDPIFLPDGYEITCAEMTTEEKNELSHRAIAFRNLRSVLEKK